MTPWGISAGKVGFDFAKVMARKDALIQDFADYRRQQLASGKFNREIVTRGISIHLYPAAPRLHRKAG